MRSENVRLRLVTSAIRSSRLSLALKECPWRVFGIIPCWHAVSIASAYFMTACIVSSVLVSRFLV